MVSAGLMGIPSLVSLPFVLAGAIKIVYDLLLFRAFARRADPASKDRLAPSQKQKDALGD